MVWSDDDVVCTSSDDVRAPGLNVGAGDDTVAAGIHMTPTMALALVLIGAPPATTTTTTTTTTPTTTAAPVDAADAEIERYVQRRQQLAQRVLGLDEAAAAVDEHVAFEAPIAAISFKNTPPLGVYLSFGAPYPQQTLSVWFPKASWDALPRRPSLGRRVRIEGIVHTTPTGPTIDVTDVEQLRLVRVDEIVLSDAALRGRMSYLQLRLALEQLLERGSGDDVTTAAELERIANTLAGCVTCGSHRVFFAALLPSSIEDIERRRDQLETWRKRSPSSTWAVLALAQWHLHQATNARSTATTTQQQARTAAFNAAAALLEQHPSTTSSPVGWHAWLQVALGLEWDDRRYQPLFNSAVAQFPDDMSLQGQAMLRLVARGRRGDLERFVDEQRRRRTVVAGDVEGDELYARLAWQLDELFPHAVFRSTRLQWPVVARGLEALIAQADDVILWRNVYAHLAFEQGDRRRLAPVIAQIPDDEADMGVWTNLDNVRSARHFAEGGERPRVPVAPAPTTTPAPSTPRSRLQAEARRNGAITGDSIDEAVDDDTDFDTDADE